MSPIDNCYSTTQTTGSLFTAGLVGYTFNKIDKCYAKGDVSGSRYGAGVVGELDGKDAQLTNSFACNNVLSLSGQSAWGCRVIGGFKNGASEPDESNYALSSMQVSVNGVSQKKTDDALEGKAITQAQLKKKSTYEHLGWDFNNTWRIEEGAGYPYLADVIDIEEPDEPVNPEPVNPDNPDGPDEPETITVTDISKLTDAIYAEIVSSQSSAEATLTICLKNAKAATAYSFDLQLPEGVSLVKDNNGGLSIHTE